MRSVTPGVFDAARLPDASATNPPVPIMDAGKEQAVPLRELFIRRRVASKAYPSLPNFFTYAVSGPSHSGCLAVPSKNDKVLNSSYSPFCDAGGLGQNG